MAFSAVIQAMPLATACVWLGLVLCLVARDRFRTWTEVLLLVLAASLGLYALSDFAFLNASTPGVAETASRASLALISIAVAAFALFAFVLRDRMRPRLALLLVAPIGAIALAWTRVVTGSASAADVGLPYRAVFDPVALKEWAAYSLAYAALGLGLLWRTFAAMKRAAAGAARRLRLFLLALLLAVLSGASTNLLAALLGIRMPPLFSTLLVVPGVLAFAALAPATELPFVEAAARWKARGYRIEAAFLTHEDGTLLGSRVRPGEPALDGDRFGATLDVIQNFMRSSFPRLEGKWLRSVSQGDDTLVIERGSHTCLTLVLQGKENDQLRRLMRDALRRYEKANAEVLAHSSGVADEAGGTTAMLMSLLEG